MSEFRTVPMIHFNNTTGKNKGKLQITKLAAYLEKSEGTLRAVRKRNNRELEILHLGSLCKVNNINESDLKEFLYLRK